MYLDLALLIVRVVFGALLFGHGAQKLFGWFGGYGLAGTSGFFGGHLRLRPAKFWTLLGGLTEVGGGLLLVLGFLSPLGPVAAIAAMLMAITVHWPKVWATESGYEPALLYLAAALAIGLVGPGAFAIDSSIGFSLPEPITLTVGIVLSVLGVIVAHATKAPAEHPVAAAAH